MTCLISMLNVKSSLCVLMVGGGTKLHNKTWIQSWGCLLESEAVSGVT